MKTLLRYVSTAATTFVESVRMSVSNICQNRMRSFLTILGIMIGVTAVIALITTISGASSSLPLAVTSMGAGTLRLSAPGSDRKGGRTAEDMDSLTALDHVEGVSPTVSLSATAARDNGYESSVSIAGRNDYYFTVNPGLVDQGRAINAIDVDQSSRVCLISSELVDTFFYGVAPVGQTIYLGGQRFTVVGTLAEDGDSSISSMMSGSSDVLIPYTTALKMNGESLVTNLTVYIDSADNSDAIVAEMEPLLDSLFSYEDDTYTITTMDAIEDTMSSMLSMMSMLLGGIASIALLVGGIGIMNMMLTSVTERTVEIGLKKAIGAEPVQIQLQFLIESFLLSMVGGLIGVVLGISLSAILCSAMGTAFTISYGAIALGVGFSAAVGIVFGWSPARKASRLSPIEALRRM